MLEKIKAIIKTEKGKHIVSIVVSSLIVYNFFPIIGLIFPRTAGMFTFFMELLIINPLYVVVVNLILSEMSGLNWKEPVLVSLLFIPSIFIFYNATAVVYIFIYMALAFISGGLGNLIYKKIKKS